MNIRIKHFSNSLSLISFFIILLHFNLSAAAYSDGSWDCKLPDEIGNLFKTKEQTDREYGKAGQLLKDETYSYSYDEVGNLIPFKYQGQYEDVETGLCYNRFRYYDSNSGTYISQDPIKLFANNPNFYAYTWDSNISTDPFGLSCSKNAKKMSIDDIGEFLGSSNWHKNGAKTKFLKFFRKKMKGDTNADFYVDKISREVLLLTNRKKIWGLTGHFFH